MMLLHRARLPIQRHGYGAAARKHKTGLVKGRRAKAPAGIIGKTPRLNRHAQQVGVQLPVVIYIMKNAEGILTSRQIRKNQ
jgi:hypothetical protein